MECNQPNYNNPKMEVMEHKFYIVITKFEFQNQTLIQTKHYTL